MFNFDYRKNLLFYQFFYFNMWDSYVYLQGYYFTEVRLFNVTLSGRHREERRGEESPAGLNVSPQSDKVSNSG